MARKQGKYEKISREEGGLDHNFTSERPAWPLTSAAIFFAITTIIFGLTSLYLSLGTGCTAETHQHGFPTEWGPAKASIQMKKEVYTSPLRYNATSDTVYRDFDPSQPRYVGEPSPEIDRAWEELLAGQYLVIPKEEAIKLDEPMSIGGAYVAEEGRGHAFSALLECDASEFEQLLHIDHCIEQLRQVIQCGGDLTPVSLHQYGKQGQKILIGAPQVHTCRDWGAFREWYMDKGAEWGNLVWTGI